MLWVLTKKTFQTVTEENNKVAAQALEETPTLDIEVEIRVEVVTEEEMKVYLQYVSSATELVMWCRTAITVVITLFKTSTILTKLISITNLLLISLPCTLDLKLCMTSRSI